MDPAPAPAAIEFGRFSVLPHRRELRAEGRPLELGGRAFDVLMALIEASGAVISEGVLMERVWPDRGVEKNSVQAQISALRAAFGPERDLIRKVASWKQSRAATLNITATSSSGPKPSRRCGPLLSGWPITGAKSTIYARRSTGRFRPQATR